jgi:PTH1 family peptidyl-tRNA hydrolase
MPGEPLKLIVGLGNPGTEYARTRHNAGFQFADELARRYGATFRSEPRHRGELARAQVANADVWLLKPMSYMNHSGEAVRSVATFYKIPVAAILVAYDELDFPAGVVRLKQGGGAAGHNGMRDVIAQMGDAFWRLRIGIGHPGDRAQVLDYVLGRPNATDAPLLQEALLAAADAVPVLLTEGAQIAMHRLHGRDPPAPPPAN